MPSVSKTEREAFSRFIQLLDGSASLKGCHPWVWLDGFTTERIYEQYLECGGTRTLKGFTTRLLNYIGRDYIGTEVCRRDGKVCRKYYTKKT